MKTALLLAALAVVGASTAHAAFDQSSLNGRYSFVTAQDNGRVHVETHASPSSFQIDAVIGTFTFDGAGGVTATRRLTWNGPIIITERQVGAGTYAVTPDGTATMTITWPETPWMPNSVWFHRRLPAENYELSIDGRGFHFVVDVDHDWVEADGTVLGHLPRTASVGRAENDVPCGSATALPPGLARRR